MIKAITFIDMKNLRSTDLNLLFVFVAMMSERSVTRAADRLGLAQSSMSNALSRLRVLFDDELFVRTREGMVPTPIAIDASKHVHAALQAAEDAINVGGKFDPASAEGKVIILTHDLIEMTLLPDLVKKARERAPRMKIFTRALIRNQFAGDLDAGLADFAICASSSVPKRFSFTPLFVEPFVCIARIDHPIVGNGLTLEKFVACEHALVSQRSDGHGLVDNELASLGHSRRVKVSVANFASVPPLVVETDIIAVLPRRLASKASQHLPVKMFELPFDLPRIEAKLIWGRGADRSPVFLWFRRLIEMTVQDQ